MSDDQHNDVIDNGPDAAEIVELVAEEYAWLRCDHEGPARGRFVFWLRQLPPEKRAIIEHLDMRRVRHYLDLRARLLQPNGDH